MLAGTALRGTTLPLPLYPLHLIGLHHRIGHLRRIDLPLQQLLPNLLTHHPMNSMVIAGTIMLSHLMVANKVQETPGIAVKPLVILLQETRGTPKHLSLQIHGITKADVLMMNLQI